MIQITYHFVCGRGREFSPHCVCTTADFLIFCRCPNFRSVLSLASSIAAKVEDSIYSRKGEDVQSIPRFQAISPTRDKVKRGQVFAHSTEADSRKVHFSLHYQKSKSTILINEFRRQVACTTLIFRSGKWNELCCNAGKKGEKKTKKNFVFFILQFFFITLVSFLLRKYCTSIQYCISRFQFPITRKHINVSTLIYV